MQNTAQAVVLPVTTNSPDRAKVSSLSARTIKRLSKRELTRAFVGKQVSSLDYLNEVIRRKLYSLGMDSFVPFADMESARTFNQSISNL